MRQRILAWLIIAILTLPFALPVLGATCTGGCYSSSANCQRNCGQPCARVDPVSECGWPKGYVAYRCCPGPTVTVTPKPTPTVAPTPLLVPAESQPGIAYQQGGFEGYAPLRFSWWYNYYPNVTPEMPQYVQVIRLKDWIPPVSLVQQAAAANPASVWIIGNEPDEPSQDNMTPDQYAQAWRYWSQIIRKADPYALLGFGPIADMGRTWYLDQALAAYKARYKEELSPDLLVPHGYGCGTNAKCFADKTKAFRKWMAGRGWQNRPLWIAEYGVLGNPTEANAKAFMKATWDFMQSETDQRTGYPHDTYRLVQRWAWFSGNCAQNVVPHAALYNGKALSTYGKLWAEYWK